MPSPYLYYVYPFGQMADDLTAIPTLNPVDGSVSYQNGWTDPYELNLLTDPAALPVPRGQMNQLFFDITNNIQEYQQYGTPQWISGLVFNPIGPVNGYPIYARVYYSGQVYESQISNNTNTPGTDTTWVAVGGNIQGVVTGTVIDFAGPLAPSGYLACTGTPGSPLTVSRTAYARLMSAITQIQSVTTTLSATVTGLTNATTTMYVGMPIESANFPSGTTIQSITNSTTVVMNQAATIAGATTIQFFNWGNGDGSTTFTLPSLGYAGTMGAGGTPGTTSQAPGNMTGQYGGEAQHTQQVSELAAHNHPGSTVGASTDQTSGTHVQTSSISNVSGTLSIATSGSSTPFNVIGPTAIVNKCIKF